MATVSVRPSRLSGRTLCLIASSPGMSFAMRRIDLELRQVDRGHLVLPREHPGEVGLLYVTELDQVVADAGAVLSLLLKSLIELILGDQALSQKQIAQSGRFCGRSCQGRMSLR